MAGIQHSNASAAAGLDPPPPLADRQKDNVTPTELMERRRRRAQEIQRQQKEKEDQQRQREREVADKRRSSAGGGETNANTQARAPLDPVLPPNQRYNTGARPPSDPQKPTQASTQPPTRHIRGSSDIQPPNEERRRSSRDPQPQNEPPQQAKSAQPAKNKAVSSFPHAFERWENLSSHWEGLTGYWIKRIQNNSDELNDRPLEKQLARQVLDLTSAGANLFHAVVELQRLRASSERKFQRWFFETRADQEKQTEEIAKLKAQIRDMRSDPQVQPAGVSREMQDLQDRQIRETQEQMAQQLRVAEEKTRRANESAQQQIELIRQQSEKQLTEMRRELQISRDEARRGWEEIGRMEQSERDRMFSLKRGEPTLVGGVQVVPMMARPAVSSRPTTREGGLSSHPVQPEDIQYGGYDVQSEADTDPFTESGGQKTSSNVASRIAPLMPQSQPQTTYPTSAAAVAASTRAVSASPNRPAVSAGTASPHSAPSANQTAYPPRSESYGAPRPAPTSAPAQSDFYQQQQPILHQRPGQSQPTVLHADEVRSYGTVSDDGYDVQGNAQREAPGRPAAYQPERLRSPSEASDDYGTAIPPGTGYAYATSNGNSHMVSAPDYSGAGYGRDEWGAVIGRHHHPTRLSDIVEENSRTSPSRASERSHGFR